MIREILREWLAFAAVIAFVGLLLWTVLTDVPASAGRIRPQFDGLRVVTIVARIDPEGTPISAIGSSMYELGRESARIEIKLESAKAELYEIERVVYFSECLEQRSGKVFKAAFHQGAFNEACLAEAQRMTPEQISQVAQAIIAAKKAKP